MSFCGVAGHGIGNGAGKQPERDPGQPGHERLAEGNDLLPAPDGPGNPRCGITRSRLLRGNHAPALKGRTAGVSWLPDRRSPRPSRRTATVTQPPTARAGFLARLAPR